MEKNSITYIPLNLLLFDPKNPRLPETLRDITDESAILRHMLRDESLIELMKSIAEMGYSSSEPLLVVKSDTIENSYIVVEGNRRLAALKLLSCPDLAPIRQKSVRDVIAEKQFTPESIPCLVYPCRNHILDYLGYRHITGVKSWGALEKARYLKQLYDRHIEDAGPNQVCSVLAKMIGSRKDYVAKLLTAYALYEHANEQAYYGIDIEEKDVDFSLLSTSLSYENLFKFIGLESAGTVSIDQINDDNYSFLFHCLYDPKKKIGESRQLKQLSHVIGNPQALAEYRKGCSLQTAAYYTSEPMETFQRFLGDAEQSLENAKNGVERIPLNAEEFDALEMRLNNIRKLATSILGALKELVSDE